MSRLLLPDDMLREVYAKANNRTKWHMRAAYKQELRRVPAPRRFSYQYGSGRYQRAWSRAERDLAVTSQFTGAHSTRAALLRLIRKAKKAYPHDDMAQRLRADRAFVTDYEMVMQDDVPAAGEQIMDTLLGMYDDMPGNLHHQLPRSARDPAMRARVMQRARSARRQAYTTGVAERQAAAAKRRVVKRAARRFPVSHQ